MALADKLSRRVAEKEGKKVREEQETKAAQAQAEVLEKQQAEESRLEGLRQSIGILDSRLESMRTLLTELTQTHEKAGVSVAGAKKEGKALTKAISELEKLFENEQFHAILEEEGISSLEDLLKAEQYSEESEIKTVKQFRESRTIKRQTARESIAARRKVKVKAAKALLLEKPDITLNRVYRDVPSYPSVTTALERTIQELEQERKTLFDQTPEGQEVVRKEMFERVRQQYESQRNVWRSLISASTLDNQVVWSESSVEDAKKYGAEKVKSVIKEYYGQVIDRDLQEQAKRNGVIQLQEAVDTIESLPRRWNEVSDRLQQVRQERQKTIDSLNSLLGIDSGAPLLKQVKAYEQWGDKNLNGLAEAFVDRNEKLTALWFGLDESNKTPTDLLEKMIADQKQTLDQFHQGDSKKIFLQSDILQFSSNTQIVSSLTNPERAIVLLDELENFYHKFQMLLAKPAQEISQKMRDITFGSELRVRSTKELGLGSDKMVPYVIFDRASSRSLFDHKFEDVKKRLEKEQQAIEKKRTQLKEQLSDKVDADWDEEQLSKFVYKEKNDRTIAEAESRIRLQESAKKASSNLDIAILPLKELLHQEVNMNQNGRIEFFLVPEKDLKNLDKKMASLRSQMEEKEEKFDTLEKEILENKGWFQGGIRKKKEAEKKFLLKEVDDLLEQLKTIEEENIQKTKLDSVLEQIRMTLHDVRRIGLLSEAPLTPVSLQEFIDTTKKQLVVKLTPTQSSVWEQYQVLVKKRDETRNTYQKKWRSSIGR